MSLAPQSLIDLRQFLSDKAAVKPRNFGITGNITPRRPWGFHLSPEEIYGPKGMGDDDYSVRDPRNRGKVGKYSAGFDIRLSVAQLRKLNAYLLEMAKSGKDGGMLFEIIGPHPDTGAPTRWTAKRQWQPDAKPARKDHAWHDHLSFWRDTQDRDKRPIFFGFFDVSPEPSTPELKKGASGDAVKLLHDRLALYDFEVVAPSDPGYGVFGAKTEAAVKQFQEREELVVDGVVGPQTWAVLMVDPPLEPPPGEPPVPDPGPMPPDPPDSCEEQVADLTARIAAAKEALDD